MNNKKKLAHKKKQTFYKNGTIFHKIKLIKLLFLDSNIFVPHLLHPRHDYFIANEKKEHLNIVKCIQYRKIELFAKTSLSMAQVNSLAARRMFVHDKRLWSTFALLVLFLKSAWNRFMCYEFRLCKNLFAVWKHGFCQSASNLHSIKLINSVAN